MLQPFSTKSLAVYQLWLEAGSAFGRRSGVSYAPLVEGAARNALFFFSLSLMISVALLRQLCLYMLGDHFTYDVRVSENTNLQARNLPVGAYPSYTGGMLFISVSGWR